MNFYGKGPTVDLHGMTVIQAEIELTRRITMLDYNIKQITVIHGYNMGNRLLEFVRKEYIHPRIKDIKYSDNYGETIYLLY